ncbi:exported hypothetical protein [Desulfamplus magnetovallimortis]|uniref:Cellulose synthase operon C C-terminal domain-containing protein n=1 Tax=Desulfamplus magnetovallimortis TaxID=1246637 RepID=A0A1W1HJ47_9BACT|nr:cellulose synthase subunit BcsC-related outer membrane protein [Desulfamplus magnetovallimortis]SLM32435.1 exported hypothetical protein [Desulfamplus magnetovallimortis]
MKKLLLIFYFVLFLFNFLFASPTLASVPLVYVADSSLKTPVHAGTAWDAYNSGNFSEAEEQFIYLIKTLEIQYYPVSDEKNIETLSGNSRTSDAENLENLLNLKLGLAYTFVKLEKLNNAATLFETLIKNGYRPQDSVPAMLDVLLKLKSYDKMDTYLDTLGNIFDSEEIKKWNYLRVAFAWAAYNEKNYKKAEDIFKILLKANPYDMTLVTGLGYSLYNQNKNLEACELLQGESIEDTSEILELKKNLYNQGCLMKGVDGSSPQSNSDNFEKTVDDKKLQKVVDEKNIQKVVDEKNIQKVIDEKNIQKAIDEKNIQKAIDEKDIHITKDNKLKTTENSFNYIASYRLKDGDKGTSKLKERSVLYGYANGSKALGRWGIALKAREISPEGRFKNTNESNLLQIGSYYRRLNGSIAIFTDDDKEHIFEAWLDYKNDLPFDINIALGTSPVGGAVDFTPAFKASADLKLFSFKLHRLSVDESRLSISGMHDPYGEKTWGRVMKNGFVVGKNISVGESGWLTLNGGYDIYRGKNVLKNSAFSINGALGRTILRENKDELSYGAYISWAHFDHNSNFFTFGHGGYYSPDLMLTAGPILRYKTGDKRDYLLDFQVSMGWMVERTDDAPRYPIHYEETDSFSSDSIAELQGIFKGDEDNLMGASAKLEGWKIISDMVAVNGLISMDKGSDYTQWRIYFGVDCSFEPRKFFLQQKSVESIWNNKM